MGDAGDAAEVEQWWQITQWLRWLRFTRPGFERGTIAVLVELDEPTLRRIEHGYAVAPPEVRDRIAELARRWGYV